MKRHYTCNKPNEAKFQVCKTPSHVQQDTGKTKLKILFLHPPLRDTSRFDGLHCSRDTWQAVQDALLLPGSALKGIVDGGCRPFTWQRPHSSIEPTMTGALVTQRSFDVWASLVVSHHHPSGTTWAVLDSYSKASCQTVLEKIQQTLDFSWLPSVLPLLVLEHISAALRRQEEGAFARLNVVRTTIGISPYRDTTVNFNLDLVANSVELTKLAQLYTALGHEYDMLALNVSEMIKFHQDFHARASLNWGEGHREKWCQVQDRLEYLDRWALLRQQWNACRIAEVQGSTQTVYSLIGSRDNDLNFQAAATSARIAELSRKDSSDMRVIAAVTLLFLPATFAATLFSTSFFDFKPQGAAHVSSWFWLYWVVTVGLTMTVGAAWFLSSRSLAIMTARKEQLDIPKPGENL